MGERYLIDSNVIIDYASLRLPKSGSDFLEHIFNADFLISVVVKIEVLGFNDVPQKLNILEEFINSATILHLDESLVQKTILLKREYKKLKLGDAIIAATALVNNFTLITRNVADFKNVEGLNLMNAHTI